MTAKEIESKLKRRSNDKRALAMQRFFQTGKGQYGAGDVFIGVSVPDIRKLAKEFCDLPLPEVQKLLDSKIHEHRLAGLIILANQYPKADNNHKQNIYDLYLRNVYKGRVNNWDLVDVTTPSVIGEHLVNKPRDVLFELARSDNIWQKRIAIMATFAFIKREDPSTTLDIAEILLHDNHDLIHKAVGWMLREMGKRVDEQLLTDFLDKHAHEMPRTMLRYSLEKLPVNKKEYYMKWRLV